ncbi:hypothetical protein V8F06_003002 [Rhypophila decipiens]
MLPTPDTSHVPYQRVYEPAEDSFLLLDTLSSPSETSFLTSRFGNQQPAPLILEVGPGSGVVIAFLTANAHTILGTSNLLTLAIDVNRYACTSTLQTVSRAIADSSQQQQPESQSAGGTGTGTFLTPLQGDLTTPLRKNQVDVLVFNPPYVPTEELPSPPSPTTTTTTTTTKSKGDNTTFAQDSHLLELSYAGGKDGMETTNKLLDSLPTVLSDRGVAYILLCAQNKPDEVKERIRAWECPPLSSSLSVDRYSWKAETVGFSGKQAGWEKLQIVRIWRDFSA